MSSQDIFGIVAMFYAVANLASMGIELNLGETIKSLRSFRVLGLTLGWSWVIGPAFAVLAFIRPYKSVIDCELLPYHRFGLGKYESLGVVYELDDYKTPSDELVQHLQTIIDEAFGRSEQKAPGVTRTAASSQSCKSSGLD